MTILQSLDRYYDRMAARGEAPPAGYVAQRIKGEIILAADGELIAIKTVGEESNGKVIVAPEPVTEPEARSGKAIVPYFLVDNPSYLLGTKPDDKRVQTKFERSAEFHSQILGNPDDCGLKAILAYFKRHGDASSRAWAVPFFDGVVAVRLEGRYEYLHDCAEAREAWERYLASIKLPVSTCLVTGIETGITRLHPKLAGFKDADTLVGFNEEAFKSYGKEQGANAPTSKAAAFRYGAALNRMLDRGSPNRLQRSIGNATIVFWADAAETEAKVAEDAFSWLIEPPSDAGQTAKLRNALADVASGHIGASAPDLKPGVRFHVLGLSPNAARLSVRFWAQDDFSVFAQRLLDHEQDFAMEPRPWGPKPPSVFLILCRATALQEKAENVPNALAGEVMRALLTGGRYPRSLLSAAIMRLRAGDDASTGWHAAAIRAVLAREFRLNLSTEETPVSLDRENANPAYRLGRLFAAYEAAQRLALGKVNATIRDKYFGAASATPASIFPLIVRGAQNHLAKLRKEKPGLAFTLDKEIEEIFSRMEGEWPRSLPLEAQGRFAIGYYHQRRGQFEGKKELEAELAATEGSEND